MTLRSVVMTALALCAPAAPLLAQGVVIDQGRFEVRIDGKPAGTEDFVIRRASLDMGAAFFANGTVSLTPNESAREVRPLMRAAPPDGQAESYQVQVSGEGAMELRLARSGRRYVATIRSEIGAEDREFQFLPGTKILDLDVAHHHYFLRDLRVGRSVHVLEPRARAQYALTATSRTDEELQVGPNLLQVRRVDLSADGGHDRTVWYDRQGRVVRVEIPDRSYVAQRTDLVG